MVVSSPRCIFKFEVGVMNEGKQNSQCPKVNACATQTHGKHPGSVGVKRARAFKATSKL